MTGDTDMETRLESLESRLMHQEASLEEMTAALLAQERLVRQQAELIEQLQGQVRALNMSGGLPPGDEKPPHY